MAWPIFADPALSHQIPSVRHHRTSRNRPEPATAAATKSRAISRHPVASASSSSQIGQAAPGAAGFCYLVNRRGETLASNYRQSNVDDGRVIHAPRPACLPVEDRCRSPPGPSGYIRNFNE